MEQIISKLIGLHNVAISDKNFAMSYNGNVHQSTHYQFMAEGIMTCIYYLGYKPILKPCGCIDEAMKMMEPDYMGLYHYYTNTKDSVMNFLNSNHENLLNIKSGVLTGIFKCIEVIGSDKFDEYCFPTLKHSNTENSSIEEDDDDVLEDDEIDEDD